MSDDVYTIGELAERLKVSRDTIERHLRLGTIRCIKVGSRRRITHAEYERILQDGTDRFAIGPVAGNRYASRTGSRYRR